MVVPSNPSWAEDHIRRLAAAGIQSEFQCHNIHSFEAIERMIRRGVCKGPLVMSRAAISGGMDQADIFNLANMLRTASPARARSAWEACEKRADRASGKRPGIWRMTMALRIQPPAALMPGAAALLPLCAAAPLRAQDGWPTRPIQMIVAPSA